MVAKENGDYVLRLRRSYISKGYFDVLVRECEKGDSTLLKIYTGPRYRIGSVAISPSPLSSEFIRKAFNLSPGTYYDEDKIEDGIEQILEAFLNQGYPFCQIRPSLEKSDHLVRINVDILAGPLVRLSDLLYSGRTKTWAVKRWVEFQPMLFSEEKVTEWKDKLKQLSFIALIKDRIIRVGNEYYLQFLPQEIGSEVIELGGTFLPKENELFALISFSSENLLGTMRRLSLRWETKKRLEVSYLEPWLIYPFQLGLKFYDIWFDSLRVSRFEVSFSRKKITIYTGIERGDKRDEFIGMRFDSRPFPCSLGGFTELVRVVDKGSYLKGGGWIKLWLHPLSLLVNGRHTTLRHAEVTDYFRIGGITSLRGYWEEELYFLSGLWINNELKLFPLLYPFIDIAFLGGEWYYGSGIGFDLTSSRLGLKLALGIPNRDFFQAKFHLLITGRL